MTTFDQIVTYIIVLPTLIFFFLKSEIRNSYLFLGANLLLGILSEIFSVYFKKNYGTNLPIYNIYFLFNFTTIYLFLVTIKDLLVGRKKMFLGILFIMLAFWFIEVFLLSSIFKIAYLFIIITSLIILILAISFLNKVVLENSKERIPNIIIGIAMVLYNAFLVFVYLMSSPIFDFSKEILIRSWDIAKINNLLYYLLITIAFLWTKRR